MRKEALREQYSIEGGNVLLASKTLRTDDILLSLLVLNNHEGNRITGVSRDLHRTVYELKKRYPDIFGEFNFSKTTLFPYSDDLAESLQSLHWSRLIGMENPDFRVYFVKQAAHKTFEAIIGKGLDHDVKARLQEASRAFWTELAVK